MNRYPKFKIITPPNETIQEGYVDLNTIGEEDPLIKWYDEYGIETIMPRNEPYSIGSKEYYKFQDTMKAWILDEEFFELIEKYQDENKTLEREGYVLVINEGETNADCDMDNYLINERKSFKDMLAHLEKIEPNTNRLYEFAVALQNSLLTHQPINNFDKNAKKEEWRGNHELI